MSWQCEQTGQDVAVVSSAAGLREASQAFERGGYLRRGGHLGQVRVVRVRVCEGGRRGSAVSTEIAGETPMPFTLLGIIRLGISGGGGVVAGSGQ